MENFFKAMAIFMSCLVVTLPFYVSGVSAQLPSGGSSGTIVISNVEGEDGIDEILKEDDILNVTATMTHSGIGVPEASSVRFSTGTWSTGFEECTAVSGYENRYKCSYSSEISEGQFLSGAYPYRICLSSSCGDDCMCGCLSESGCSQSNFYVDAVPPSFESYDISPEYTNGDEVTLDYKVKDRACFAPACDGECAGIEKIEVVQGSAVLHTIDIGSEDCTHEEQETFSLSSIPDGVNQICLRATDLLGQESYPGTACVQITKDDTSPTITSADIYESSGTYPLTYVKPSATQARIMANITMPGLLEIDSAEADLTGLGMSTYTLDCEGEGNDKYCYYDFTLSSPVTGDMVVTVTDEGGNVIEETTAISIEEDDTDPALDSIITGSVYDDQAYVGPLNNTIIAVMDEEGSGFYGTDVTIEIDGASHDAECSESGGEWHCYVHHINTTSDITAEVSGEDTAGNAFSDSADVPYDGTAPVIDSVTLFNLAYTEHPQYPFVFLTGDDLLVRVNLTEDPAMTDDSGNFHAKGNFSSFASSNLISAEGCYKGDADNAWFCEWGLQDVLDGPITARFDLRDIIGNIENSTLTDPVTEFYLEYIDPATGELESMGPVPDPEVYWQETNESNYWNATVEGVYPSAIDSETLQILEHDVWFKLKLHPRVEDVSIVSATFNPESCGWDFDDYADATTSTLVMPVMNSTEPWIRIRLRQGTINQDRVKFNCTMTLISLRKGNLSMPEIENITLTAGVYKYKEVSDSVIDEIKDIREGWLVQMGDWLSQIQKVLEISELLCEVSQAIAKIYLVFSTINAVTAPLQGTLLDAVAEAGNALGTVGEQTDNAAVEMLDKFCQFVSCTFTLCDKAGGEGGEGGLQGYCSYFDDKMGRANDVMSNQLPPRLEAFSQGDILTGIGGGADLLGSIASDCKSEHCGEDGECDADERKDYDACLIEGKEEEGLYARSWGDVFWTGNPKDSLVQSIITLCIPGIIYNMNKMTEVECQYLICLQEYVPAGVPITMCTQMRSYQWCMFIWGEAFNFIPFAKFIENMLQTVAQMLANPTQLVLSYVFQYACNNPDFKLAAACRLIQVGGQIQYLVDLYERVAESEDKFDFEQTLCKRALDYDLPDD